MSTQSLTAVQSGAYTYLVDESTGKAYKVDDDTDISVFGTSNNLSVGDGLSFETTSTSADYACTDGKNDGKISATEACVSAFKGIAKMVVSPITEALKGNFVPAIASAVMAAGISCLGPVGFIGAGVVGLLGGGVQLYKGVTHAQDAKTDGEAKMAYEEIGQGGFATLTSLFGLKAGIKQFKTMKTSGTMADADGFVDKTKAYFKDLKTNKAAARAARQEKAEQRASERLEADELKASEKAERKLWKERKKADDQLTQKEIDKLVKRLQQEEGAPATSTENLTQTGQASTPSVAQKSASQIKIEQLAQEYNDEYFRTYEAASSGDTVDTTTLETLEANLKSLRAKTQQYYNDEYLRISDASSSGDVIDTADLDALQLQLDILDNALKGTPIRTPAAPVVQASSGTQSSGAPAGSGESGKGLFGRITGIFRKK